MRNFDVKFVVIVEDFKGMLIFWNEVVIVDEYIIDIEDESYVFGSFDFNVFDVLYLRSKNVMVGLDWWYVRLVGRSVIGMGYRG